MRHKISHLRDHQRGASMSGFIGGWAMANASMAPREMSGLTVLARVHESKWIVDCPDEYCTSAMMADLDEPRFFCIDCRNIAVGGRWIAVEFPPQREAIEMVLMKRPDPMTRNWFAGETLADLRRENKEHGV